MANGTIVSSGNMNVNSPLDIGGKATFGGNMNLNAGIMAQGDISITGGVINANNSVICSKTGNLMLSGHGREITLILDRGPS